jgi:predicted RNA-binding protein YlxR (DUF448 family)
MNTKPIVPQRTCVSCKKRFNQAELLAVTRLKDGRVVVNENLTRKGRSVYVCKKAGCLGKIRGGKKQNGLLYGLKVKIPDGVWNQLEKFIKTNAS